MQQGGPNKAALHPDATLLLCYPAPDNEMALQALNHYNGSTICYIGEWGGDTGTRGFEKELEKLFFCAEVVALPNWGDTCYSMMVWRRRLGGSEGPSKEVIHSKIGGEVGTKADHPAPGRHLSHPFCCSTCGNANIYSSRSSSSSSNSSSRVGTKAPRLFRCRMSYNVYFCSRECAARGRQRHIDELTVRGLLRIPLRHARAPSPGAKKGEIARATAGSGGGGGGGGQQSFRDSDSTVKDHVDIVAGEGIDGAKLSKAQKKNLAKKRKRLAKVAAIPIEPTEGSAVSTDCGSSCPSAPLAKAETHSPHRTAGIGAVAYSEESEDADCLLPALQHDEPVAKRSRAVLLDSQQSTARTSLHPSHSSKSIVAEPLVELDSDFYVTVPAASIM